jgi:predicted transcriptional regulator
MTTADLLRKDFVVSVRPLYAEKIIDGEKTVELRRRFPEVTATGAIVLIYSSSPVQAIVGYATISEVHRLPVNSIWSKFGKAACISRSAFKEYFEGLHEGYAIVLSNVRKFSQEIPVSQLKKRFGFIPPQSFKYLEKEYYSLLKNEHVQAPY